MNYFLPNLLLQIVMLTGLISAGYFIAVFLKIRSWIFPFVFGISALITFDSLDALILFTSKTQYAEVIIPVYNLLVISFPAAFLGFGLYDLLFGAVKYILIHSNIWIEMGYIETGCLILGFMIPCTAEYALLGFFGQKLFLKLSTRFNQEKFNSVIKVIKTAMAILAVLTVIYYVYCLVSFEYW
jgi:hypothetical protein